MTNIRFKNGLLTCLFALLPLALPAQQLSYIEYWFDNDKGNATGIAISGTERTYENDIPTDGLAPGVHQLHIRVARTDGWRSPVSTTTFFKRPAGSGRQAVYWFDDDYDNRTAYAINADGEEEDLAIDMTALATGLHRLNFRVASPDQAPSAVYSAMVLKTGMGDVDQMEYWIDNDYDGRTAVPSTHANGGRAVFMPALDLSTVPIGPHTLNYRFRSSGTTYSAVYRATILHLGMGNMNRMEYWIGDDYEGRKTISCTESDDNTSTFVADLDLNSLPVGVHRLHYRVLSSVGSSASAVGSAAVIVNSGATPKIEYWMDDDFKSGNNVTLEANRQTNALQLFVHDLDMSSLSPGVHRLRYRPVMADGKARGAIMSQPVIVKSRYDGDGSDAVLMSYSVAVDNQDPESYDIIGQPHTQEITHNLDASRLKAGEHTVTTKVWNSLGTNSTETGVFTVPERMVPTLTLTATEQDGRVTLKVDAVANDVSYHVTRVDPSGAQRRIYRTMNVYPANITCNDEPVAGQYTYYAECVYRDANGVRQSLRSADVSVSVANHQPATAQKTGYIVGYALTSNGNPLYGEMHHSWNPASVRVEENGVFVRHLYFDASRFNGSDFAVGTKLTLSVENDDYNVIRPVEVTIKEGPNQVVLTGISKELMQPNTQLYDLSLISNVDMQSGYLIFTVKNRSNRPWSGHVRFKAITESNYKKLLKGTLKDSQTDDGGDALALAGSVAQLPNYEQIWFYSYTEEVVNVSGGGQSKVRVPLNNVFPDNKRDYYYFYLESDGRWTNGVETENEVKALAMSSSEYNVTALPFMRQIDKSSLANAVDLQELKDAEFAANIILAMCSTIKGLDGQIGDIREFCEKQLKADSKFRENLDLLKLRDHIDEMTIEEMEHDPLLNRIAQNIAAGTGLALIEKFRDNVVADILAKSAKNVDEYLKPAMNTLKNIREYEEFMSKSEYDKVFYCADKILNMVGNKMGKPFSDILKTYLHVTKAFVNYGLHLGEDNYKLVAANMLQDNIPSTAEDKEKYKYNRYIDFKIKVKPKGTIYHINFEKRSPRCLSIIRDVVVKANNVDDPNQVATIFLEPVAVDDGLMLRQTEFDNGGGGVGQGALDVGKPFKRMWMEITWKNGRRSVVPLLDAPCGVKFEQPIFEAFGGMNTYRYTVTFNSAATTDHFDNLADILTLEE